MSNAIERFVVPESGKLNYSYTTRMLFQVPLTSGMREAVPSVKSRVEEPDFFVEEGDPLTQTGIMRIMSQGLLIPDTRGGENYRYSTVFDYGAGLIASSVAKDKQNVSAQWREETQYHFLFRMLNLLEYYDKGVPEIDWLWLNEIGKKVIHDLDRDFNTRERWGVLNSDRLLRDAIQLNLLTVLYAQNRDQAVHMLQAVYKKMAGYAFRLKAIQEINMPAEAHDFATEGHMVIGGGLLTDRTTEDFFNFASEVFAKEDALPWYREHRSQRFRDQRRVARESTAAVDAMFRMPDPGELI